MRVYDEGAKAIINACPEDTRYGRLHKGLCKNLGVKGETEVWSTEVRRKAADWCLVPYRLNTVCVEVL